MMDVLSVKKKHGDTEVKELVAPRKPQGWDPTSELTDKEKDVKVDYLVDWTK